MKRPGKDPGSGDNGNYDPCSVQTSGWSIVRVKQYSSVLNAPRPDQSHVPSSAILILEEKLKIENFVRQHSGVFENVIKILQSRDHL